VDVLFFNPCPDDFGHFVTVDVDDFLGNLNFFEGGGERALLEFLQHF
jgi:hypothetical protein